ncbi:hypothetical protein MIT9_P2085 [Methylomarinovum caldicuralii]|uniref:Nitroreductase n=1 Tax=Methylomarinovum caldicuralii TaxID=438856 RepID=A0AAU9C904_9GAMM|nr:nitroreductase family protein [Methylomarinovum caldicuralii]BCX82499.1 hypothetical protein MIT9_P2085 [Methylomarinovum caldicuralii]
MSRERLNVQAPVHELIAARWSPRVFEALPVEVEKLASCLEAARWAPSCYNDQPWRFLLADSHQEEEAWQRLFDCLSPGNQTWARRAPVLILACAATRFGHNGQPNRWAQYDTGQAMMSLVLQATALGLAAHQMGGFDADRVRQAFAIPGDFEPMSVLALGYPGDPAVLDEEMRQRELVPRQRKPLEEIAFAGRWGLGFTAPDSLGWEARYQESPPERLPWYHPDLDPDVAEALERFGIEGGRVLDLGTGPGTQAVALARRGFQVVATDVSPTAVEQARRLAEREGVEVTFLVDDILATRLEGPFDLILDRGVFHVFAPEAHGRYLAVVSRLLRPGGLLLLKCFSVEETRPEGPPGRYAPEDIQRIFSGPFRIVEIRPSAFARPGDDNPPKALFCVLESEEESR